MNAVNMGNLSRVVSDIKIPEKGSVCGSAITAKSSDTRYLSDSGKVTRPSSSDAEVTLTLTFTYGSYSAEKEYKVTILKTASGGGGGGTGGAPVHHGGSLKAPVTICSELVTHAAR